MKALFRRLDGLRLVSLLLWTLPILALAPLGLLWLWQQHAGLWWLLALALCSAGGYALQYGLRRRDRALLAQAEIGPDPGWSPRADNAWAAVEQLADAVKPEDWPLADEGRWWALGQNTLHAVARHFHPKQERPLLELTVPHTLLIIERASRDLRAEITAHVPFSHRLTLGDLMRAYRWKTSAERWLNWYRAGRLVVNPASALLSELWGHLRDQAFDAAWGDLHRWLLREYVRKVGYYAIELYSGRLSLSTDEPTAEASANSRAALEDAAVAAARVDEPLRILLLGRASAGKSSLINALFGQVTAATDLLPDTTRAVTPYRLERDGLAAALIFDTPGCDTELLRDQGMKKAVLEADLILWVTAAHRPDRRLERDFLDAVRALYAGRPNRRPPPVVAVVSHIDQLRPPREWEPPYDLRNPQGAKAINIRAAVEAVAADLAMPAAAVIPVCLAEGRVYNVDDALWAAILERQDAAGKVRFLRCLEQRKRDENWLLLRQQLINTGRWLLDLPGRVLN